MLAFLLFVISNGAYLSSRTVSELPIACVQEFMTLTTIEEENKNNDVYYERVAISSPRIEKGFKLFIMKKEIFFLIGNSSRTFPEIKKTSLIGSTKMNCTTSCMIMRNGSSVTKTRKKEIVNTIITRSLQPFLFSHTAPYRLYFFSWANGLVFFFLYDRGQQNISL